MEYYRQILSDCHKLKQQQCAEPDAVIVFSCATRPLAFVPMINKEVEEINKVWESPTAGFLVI